MKKIITSTLVAFAMLSGTQAKADDSFDSGAQVSALVVSDVFTATATIDRSSWG